MRTAGSSKADRASRSIDPSSKGPTAPASSSPGLTVWTRVQQAIQNQQREFASFEEARKKFERDYLAQLLKITEGNVTQAARLAKRNRTEFYKLLQRHQLDPKLFKAAARQ